MSYNVLSYQTHNDKVWSPTLKDTHYIKLPDMDTETVETV